tara:strand:+ start:539 stop:1036 length:498 start_codon:yes stop_codon:yes gene_type:complete
MKLIVGALVLGSGILGYTVHAVGSTPEPVQHIERQPMQSMQLGAFSVSLAVKDLSLSKAFYEKLGFQQVGGDPDQNWVVLGNGTAKIGLFQGMFEDNILTFNPGWAQDKTELEDFDDVRAIQARLKADGVELLVEADPASDGVAHFMLQDPDGNQILVDQHVPKP